MISSHLIPDLISWIEKIPGVKVGKVNKIIGDQIEQWQTDNKIKRLMQWYWFLKTHDSGISVLSVNEILKIENESTNLKVGYLQIGDCANGDRVYLKESDFSVWYWSHDEAKDWDVVDTNALHLTYPSIDLLLLAILNKSFIPRDSYSARDYFQIAMSTFSRLKPS
jgi:hypothetical protein